MSRVPRPYSKLVSRRQRYFRANFGLRFHSILALGLIAFLAISALIIPVLAQQDNVAGDTESAFALKADRVLAEVRRAAETDRAAAAGGRLKAGESEVERLSGVTGIRRGMNGRTSVGVNVQLTGQSDAELKAAGFAVGARIGDIATVETEIERLPELAALPSVRKLSATTFLHTLNDRARSAVGIDNFSGQRVVSQTGRGVVVGIIDTGIDFRHQDFSVPGTNGRQTRIQAILDMTYYGASQSVNGLLPDDPGWNYSLPGETNLIGHLYTKANIETALQSAKPANQSSDIVKERDKAGHGTHVAGTAAGNGLSSPTPGVYAGMAPEADLVIVKASRQNDGSDNFDDGDMINGLRFIQQKAAELGEPFVINMSIGGHGGSPHDGTDPDERAVDNLVNGGTGRAVCIAAGNEGGAGIHASGNVSSGGNVALGIFAADPSSGVAVSPQSFTLYYPNADRLSLTVTLPNGTTLNSGDFDGAPASNSYLTIYNGTDDKQDGDPSNDQSSAFIIFKSGAEKLGANWTITLHGASVTSGGHFDAWLDDGSFNSFVDDSRLVSSPGTSRGAITVGAYVTRSSSLPVGSIAPFSSPGPTADGRQKPDIVAPGYYLYSARSTDVPGSNFGTIGTGSNAPADSTHYTGLAGTSMATPVATGSVALMLQANSGLSSEQVKDSIRTSAMQGFAGQSGWDAHFGSGKLNIANAIALGGNPTYTISGHINGYAGSMAVNLSGTRSGVTSVDASGNYSIGKLPSGGNYTVTPVSTSDPGKYTFTPPGQTFNNLSANQVVNFTATIASYSVSGRVTDPGGKGVGGVDIQANPGSALKVQTDANGNYSLSLAAGPTYVITPASTDYSFMPLNIIIPSLTGNQIVNFTAYPFYSVSGRVTDRSGNGMSGVPVFDNSTAGTVSTNTDAGGYYTLSRLSSLFTHSLYANAPGYLFSGGLFNATLIGNQTVNFSGLHLYTITGRVVNASGAGVDDVMVTCEGPQPMVDLTRTSGGGYYTCLNLIEGGTDYVTPFFNGYGFTPVNQVVRNLSANTTLSDFVLSPPNPIDDSQNFVTWHYRDFLGREPDDGGLAYWSGEVNKCNGDWYCMQQRRVGVSAAFFIEQEYQQTGSFIYRLYRGALGRQPAYAEFSADRPQIIAGPGLDQSKITFTDAFVQRAVFTQKYQDKTTAETFVDALVANINASSGVDLSGQRAALVNSYNGGSTLSQSRSLTIRAAIEDAGFKQAVYNPSFVLMQYFGYLHRDPETGGYDFWLNVLNNKEPGNYRGMVCAFITSAEYQQRFGSTVTRTNRDCR